MNTKEKISVNDHDRPWEPLVSIVVITYNSAKYVIETLESAKAQTYKNIELIVSDDCSGDNTVELAELWLKEHKNRFLRSEIITAPVNTGSPANCNRAVKIASGEWLKIIAGDDILLDDCIALFIGAISDNPDLRFLTSDMQYIDADGVVIPNNDFRFNAIRAYFFSLPLEAQLKLYARVTLFINSPAFFIQKNILQDINYFDEEFTIYDDLTLIFKLFDHGIRINYLDKQTVKYRIYENSLSRTNDKSVSELRINEQIDCYKKYRKKHLKKSNLIDLVIMYEFWLDHCYKGIPGFKGLPLLYLFNFYKPYINYLAKKSKKNKLSAK